MLGFRPIGVNPLCLFFSFDVSVEYNYIFIDEAFEFVLVSNDTAFLTNLFYEVVTHTLEDTTSVTYFNELAEEVKFTHVVSADSR